MFPRIALAVTIFACFTVTSFVAADPVYESAKLVASDATSGDRFGISASVSGQAAIIGAFWDGDAGYQAGSAYIYRFDGFAWIEKQKLIGGDTAAADWFGWDVSISQDVAVVGADADRDFGTESGSAYVFRFDGTNWFEEQKLTASDAAAFDVFGRKVAVSGDVAVISAPGNAPGGSAYMFRYNGSSWIQEQKLTRAFSTYFGSAVSIADDLVVIGDSSDGENGASAGAAHVFRFNGNTWAHETKLTAPDGSSGHRFGSAVSIDGNVIIVGAYNDGPGSAHAFRYNGTSWAHEQKLINPMGEFGDRFGVSVGISSGDVIIGANLRDENGNNSGSAYLFRYEGTTWELDVQLSTTDIAPNDGFGSAVAICDGLALVGSTGDDDAGSDSGSVYVFSLDATDSEIGDMNCDGLVGTADIEPFVQALTRPADYALQYPDCDEMRADLNNDGSISGSDISSFISLLTN